jgi:type IV secretion system protein VirD4
MTKSRKVVPNTMRSALRTEILGWDDDSSFGFRTTKKLEPITYTGAGHRMTLGMTGSGKAVNSAIPELLSFEGNAIVLDIKSELFHVTHRWRREALGQKIFVLDPYNVIDKCHHSSLNPLDIGKFLGCSTYETAAMLATMFCGIAQRTVITRGSSNDEFWQDQATALLTGLIGAALEGKIECSFPAIRSLLKSDDAVYSMAVMLDKNPPSRPFREEIASFLQTVDITRSGILSSLTAHFRGIAGEGLEEVLSKSSFDMQAFVDGSLNATIYVVVPPEHLISANKFLRLIFGTLLSALFTRRYIPATKTLVQIDEAASLGQFDPLRTGITLFRGSGVVLHTLFQDIDQVITNYADARTLVNNTSIIRLLGAGNYWQAAMLNELFGITPKILMNLESDEQILLINGHPQRCRRVNYLIDDCYAGRYDANPRYIVDAANRKFAGSDTATKSTR